MTAAVCVRCPRPNPQGHHSTPIRLRRYIFDKRHTTGRTTTRKASREGGVWSVRVRRSAAHPPPTHKRNKTAAAFPAHCAAQRGAINGGRGVGRRERDIPTFFWLLRGVVWSVHFASVVVCTDGTLSLFFWFFDWAVNKALLKQKADKGEGGGWSKAPRRLWGGAQRQHQHTHRTRRGARTRRRALPERGSIVRERRTRKGRGAHGCVFWFVFGFGVGKSFVHLQPKAFTRVVFWEGSQD